MTGQTVVSIFSYAMLEKRHTIRLLLHKNVRKQKNMIYGGFTPILNPYFLKIFGAFGAESVGFYESKITDFVGLGSLPPKELS